MFGPLPRPGDVLVIDERASVQFAGDRALIVRLITRAREPTCDGWIWLTGYVLDQRGRATEKRELYVQVAGLRPAPTRHRPRQER
ncbi:hypothetical protein BDK92_6662 [Micromonospora pisi]|uniref:Uncharacterized protein n=1 Tax=Micromonospora pisi TaxID=589240 RepID=A0A495JTA9_9ACTN|nr:hypothetical protein [Micromonospora pisi]RKR92226.1 hypothetical protein BDK92_6662 [Micromonospora pisi]